MLMPVLVSGDKVINRSGLSFVKWGFPHGSVVKNPLANAGGTGDLGSEEEIATHSSILAGIIPWTEEPGRLVRGVTMSWTRLSEQLCQSGGCAQAKPLTLAVLSTLTLEFTAFQGGRKTFL